MSTADFEQIRDLEVVKSASGEGLRETMRDAECICALCTCGLHRCPSYAAQKIPFDGESTYTRDFREWQCPRHGPVAIHDEYIRNPIKFEGTSTYASDFTPKQAERTQAPPYSPPPMEKIPFDGTTTYRTDFPGHQVQRFEATGQPEYQYKSLPFEGESETRSAYKAHPLPKPEYNVHQEPALQPLPFEGESEYRKEFTKKEVHVCPASRLPAPPAPAVNPNAWVEDTRVSGQHVLFDKQARNWAQ